MEHILLSERTVFFTINQDAPYSEARYLEAIDIAEQVGAEFLVISSLQSDLSFSG